MVDDVKNHRMRRLIRLDDYLALLPFPTGTTAYLFHKLEATLERPEIGKREHVVSIENANRLDVIEVEAFGHHLGAYKDIGLTVFELIENELVAVFRARGVEVEASAASLGNDGGDILFNTFGTETMHLQVGAVA